MTKQKSRLKRANSKDSLRSFSNNTKSATVFPDFSFQSVINMVNNDPVARGVINHYVDKCMEGSYNIINRKTLKKDEKQKLTFEEKYKFRRDIIRKTFLLGKLFNNVYVEIIRDSDNKTKDLNVLDSLNVEPVTEANGDPKRYKSRQHNSVTGKTAEWKAEDIVWIKFGDRSVGYAPVDLRALWENLCIKDWVKRYLGWLWKTGQYRILYNPKSASEQDIQNFLAYNRRHESNFQAPMILKGELEVKMLRDMKEQESVEIFLKYLDGQTLILLRVLPSDAGIPDASGRSSSDSQTTSLNTSVTGAKIILEDSINFDLFPKISKANSLIRFGPNDRVQEKMVWDNLISFKGIGATNEAMEEYLESKGIFFSASKVFEDVPDPMEMMEKQSELTMASDNNKAKGMSDTVTNKTAPSRKGKTEGMANKKIGTGEQGSTRANQLSK